MKSIDWGSIAFWTFIVLFVLLFLCFLITQCVVISPPPS